MAIAMTGIDRAMEPYSRWRSGRSAASAASSGSGPSAVLAGSAGAGSSAVYPVASTVAMRSATETPSVAKTRAFSVE
jgi:hypothetical protein